MESYGKADNAAEMLAYAPAVALEASTTTEPGGASVPVVGWPHVALTVGVAAEDAVLVGEVVVAFADQV